MSCKHNQVLYLINNINSSKLPEYLNINPAICIIGLDRCSKLVQFARVRPGSLKNENTLKNPHQVVVSDNLSLPFREEAFDAVLSIAVIHHFSTTERRVQALRELARVLRIGGKVMISVWAKEQRHRKLSL
ncbi:putative tRNA methyltransferase 9B [Nymphon striatum]|nr:putative tRNA methyltransferase 9B [Nymphon striatum]